MQGACASSHLRLLLGLPRVDALEDAQPPELGQLELQLLQRLVARHILDGVARRALQAAVAAVAAGGGPARSACMACSWLSATGAAPFRRPGAGHRCAPSALPSGGAAPAHLFLLQHAGITCQLSPCAAGRPASCCAPARAASLPRLQQRSQKLACCTIEVGAE